MTIAFGRLSSLLEELFLQNNLFPLLSFDDVASGKSCIESSEWKTKLYEVLNIYFPPVVCLGITPATSHRRKRLEFALRRSVECCQCRRTNCVAEKKIYWNAQITSLIHTNRNFISQFFFLFALSISISSGSE